MPLVGYALILTFFEQLAAAEWLSADTRTIVFRARTMGVLAICLNIIPFRTYQKRWHYDSMRGVVIGTFICVGIWMYQFGGEILSGS